MHYSTQQSSVSQSQLASKSSNGSSSKMKEPTPVWVVVTFTYPEYDYAGEFDDIVGVYPTEEDAKEVKARSSLYSIYKADFHQDGLT